MKPKSRKEILNTCQNNFYNYSISSKILIIIGIVLSAAATAYYIVGFILPTIQGISYNTIIGWDIVWRIFLGFILYYILQFINLICISIGGTAICREENWESLEFARAWMNIYKYKKTLSDLVDDENSDFEK